MQSKLVLASLAAVAHRANAIKSKSSDSDSVSPAAILIGYYEDCLVKIENLTGYTSTLDGKLKLTPSFDFSGIDENCPDLTATVWMEAPATCVESDLCPEEGYTITLEPEDVKNGSWSHNFELDVVKGTWYAHVTVSPYGFECAMAMTDGCTSLEVTPECTAKVTSFSGIPAINSAKDQDDATYSQDGVYYGPDGMVHTLNWGVSDLWNCNKCATYTVQDSSGGAVASGTMDYETLAEFSEDSSISTTLYSYTSYHDWEYSLQLYDCDADTSDTSNVATTTDSSVASPYDDCVIPCSIDVIKSEISGNNFMIYSNITETPTYTCKTLYPQWFASTLAHDEYYSVPLDVTDGTQQQVSSIDTSAYPEANWDNFPILVNTTLSIYNVESRELVQTCSGQYSYWPDCDYSVLAPTIKATIEEGSSISAHKLNLAGTFGASIGDYCPQFTGEVTLFRNEEQIQSFTVSKDSMDSFTESDYTMDKSMDVDFNDGSWCVEFAITPVSAQPGEDIETKTSTRVCTSVVAPPCEVTPSTTFNGLLDTSDYMMTYTASSSYKMNVWCAMDDLSYTWSYVYMDEDERDFNQDGIDYKPALAANMTYSTSETEYESDYEISTSFEVAYNSTTFSTQDDKYWIAYASYSHNKTCRPKFAYSPVISDLAVESDDSITLSFDMMFDTAGIDNCDEMFATIQVYNELDDSLVYNMTMDDDTVNQYNAVQMPAVAISNLDEASACFMVKVTYGQVSKTASQVTQSSDATCYWPACELTEPKMSLVDWTYADDGDTFQWIFDTSVVPNKWCEDVNQQVCVTATATGAKYCDQPDDTGATLTNFTVTQDGSFNASDYEFDVTFSSSNGTHEEASGSYSLVTVNTAQPGTTNSPCKYSFESDLELITDTLTTVTIGQNTVVNGSEACGSSKQMFMSQNDGSNSSWVPLEYHEWTLTSEKKSYCFSTQFVFENYPSFTLQTDTICVDWTPACKVQITDAAIVSFVAADNATDTDASANIILQGNSQGYCGGNIQVQATLDGSDGSSYDLTVSDAFYTDAGQSISQAISRDSVKYTLSVSMDATSAQSATVHQAMTTDTGYNNIISDEYESDTYDTSPEAVCNVEVQSIEWVSYEEIDEWRGNMTATYTGVVTAEESCDSLAAKLRIKDSSSDAYFNETDVTLEPTGDGITYTWTQSIDAPNNYQVYVGKIMAHDTKAQQDYSWEKTSEILWAPPCYLEIDEFKKTGQVESNDQARTVLDYNIKLSQHGDQACNNSIAEVTLYESTEDDAYFWMWLEDSDLEVALSDDGFDLSIQTQSESAAGAKVYFKDERAVENATSLATGFTTPNSHNCEVTVYDFCLIGAEEVSTGYWGFNFTIRVEQNSQCGSLTASIDLFKDSTYYFANAVIDGDEIIEVFNCGESRTFTVYADYDGAPADVYGQLDIRNGQQEVIQIVDSCSLELP